jgi:hypothetical protein
LISKIGPPQNLEIESELGKGSTFSFRIFYKNLDYIPLRVEDKLDDEKIEQDLEEILQSRV